MDFWNYIGLKLNWPTILPENAAFLSFFVLVIPGAWMNFWAQPNRPRIANAIFAYSFFILLNPNQAITNTLLVAIFLWAILAIIAEHVLNDILDKFKVPQLVTWFRILVLSIILSVILTYYQYLFLIQSETLLLSTLIVGFFIFTMLYFFIFYGSDYLRFILFNVLLLLALNWGLYLLGADIFDWEQYKNRIEQSEESNP